MAQNVTYAELNLAQKVQPHQAKRGREAGGAIYAELKNPAPPSQSSQISSDQGILYQELNIDYGGRSHTKPGRRFSAWAWILAGIVGVLLVTVTVTLLVKFLPNSQAQRAATNPNSTNMTTVSPWTPQTTQISWTSQPPRAPLTSLCTPGVLPNSQTQRAATNPNSTNLTTLNFRTLQTTQPSWTTQTPDSSPGATSLNCSAEGWEAFGESCYLICETSQNCGGKQPKCKECSDCDREKHGTWNCSRRECSCDGADLVTIDSRQELEFLHSRLRPSGCYYYIALNKIQDQWRWINGEPLIESRVPLKNINNTETRDYHCATIGHGNVSTAPCSDNRTHNWICEKGAGGRSRPTSRTQARGA
uniref:C-type lectin domain-containing protein n=1 Tax=Ornithorhynchus anatinus TaxID=9258 RepID=A0A6I8NAB1_ORNAN